MSLRWLLVRPKLCRRNNRNFIKFTLIKLIKCLCNFILSIHNKRPITDLEELFNITLIQRSTRHFKVTALGQKFFEACKKIIHQTDDAKSILTKQGVEPHGLIKVSCPPVIMQYQVHRLLAQFLKKYPKLQLKINLTSQRIDVLQDDVDLAIRTNFFENKDSSIIVRDVIRTTHCLVASPELIKKIYYMLQI